MAQEKQAVVDEETPSTGDPIGDSVDKWFASQPEAPEDDETAASESSEPEAEEASEDAAPEPEEKDTQEPPELSKEAQDLAEALGDGPIGTDDLFRVLDAKNPKLGTFFRDLQANYTRSRMSATQKDEAIDALEDRIEALQARLDADKPQAEADEEDLGIDDEQMATFEKVAKKLGFVKQQDLEAKDTQTQTAARQQAQQSYIREANAQAAKEFGGDFAPYDETKKDIVVDERGLPKSPYAQDMDAVRQRMVDPSRGVTWADIYLISRAKELQEAAYQRGLKEAGDQEAAGVRKRVNATTVTSSRSGAASPKITFIKGKTTHEQIQDAAFEKGWKAATGKGP